MKTKNFLFVSLTIIPMNLLFGQAPPDFSSVCKEEMKKLSFLVGDWKGEAIYKRGPGPLETVSQEEHIEFRLGETILLIEGVGKNSASEVIFNAMGIVNYDPHRKEHIFKSYLKDGRSADAYFKIIDEQKFEWGFDIPNGGKTKYTIILNRDQRTWHETGEYSADGTNWMKFIELNLKKL